MVIFSNVEVENEQNFAGKNPRSTLFGAADHADCPAAQHDDHPHAGRDARPVPCGCRAAHRRHGLLFAGYGRFHDADGRGHRRTAAAHQKSARRDRDHLRYRHSHHDCGTRPSGSRRTGPVHPEQHADLDGRSRCRPVLRARTAAYNLQNTAFSSDYSVLYCSFYLFRLCAERIRFGRIRFGRCYDRPDHGSVYHGARRWSRLDTRRQRRTG